jgi:hypothetical protein
MTFRALKLDSNYNVVHVAGQLQRVSDGESVVQAVKFALSVFQGEYFLDTTAGLPYFQEILVKNPDVAQIRRRIADRIESVPGVAELVSLTLDFDRPNRTLAVRFTITTDTAELRSDTFILEAA